MSELNAEAGRRVLIIDDTIAIHQDFEKILSQRVRDKGAIVEAAEALFGSDSANGLAGIQPCDIPGFEMDSAFQGAEAVEMVKRAVAENRPYALAFVDVQMPPGWDGIETIEQIWKADSKIQTVICTAHSVYSYEQILSKLGSSDRLLILKKPFDLAEVALMASSLHKKWLLNRESESRIHQLNSKNLSLSQEQNQLKSRGGELERLVETHTEAIEATRDATVFALAKLADSRDSETGEHLARMRDYTQILAEHLSKHGPYTSEIDEVFLDDIFRSSPLHDIGKVGISDSILLKTGSLTAEEYEIMKQHTIIGAKTLQEASNSCPEARFFSMAAAIARNHHEKWDGSGYPDGLQGLNIPLSARIVALADVFDALTSKRVYKVAYSAENARSIIEDGVGRHFDPAIVEAFRECYDKFLVVVARKEQQSVTSFESQLRHHKSPACNSDSTTPSIQKLPVLVVAPTSEKVDRLMGWLSEMGYMANQAKTLDSAAKLFESTHPWIVMADQNLVDSERQNFCFWVRDQPQLHFVYNTLLMTTGENSSFFPAPAEADELMPIEIHREDFCVRMRAAQRVVTLEDRVRRLASLDPLTGVPTFEYVNPQMEREWQRAFRYRLPLSCIVVDVDGFEELKEQHGNQVGDQIVKSVAETVSRQTRSSDVFCRTSADRFLIMMIEAHEHQAAICADRVRAELVSIRSTKTNEFVKFTVSTGVTQLRRDTSGLDSLVEEAVDATLEAKRLGGNRTVRNRKKDQESGTNLPEFLTGEEPLDNLVARDVMTTPILSIRETDVAQEASRFLLRHRVNSVPVVDDRNRLVGILSEQDLIANILYAHQNTITVRDIMSTNVECFTETDSATSVYQFLCNSPIRRIVIVKDGSPTGVISRGTLLRWLGNFNSEFGPESGRLGDQEERLEQEVAMLADDVKQSISGKSAEKNDPNAESASSIIEAKSDR